MNNKTFPHPHIDFKKTGDKIRNLLREKEVSVRELCNLLDCEVQAIYNWEKGATLPKVDNLLSLSFFFDIPIDELLEYDIIENETEDEIPQHVRSILYAEKKNLFNHKNRGLTV